jgi:hypothetical protein
MGRRSTVRYRCLFYEAFFEEQHHRRVGMPLALYAVALNSRHEVGSSPNIHLQEETMIPATTTRVAEQTDEAINASIRRQTEENVAYFAAQGRGEIDRRLEELDREWDIERTLEANAASIALIGLGLGAFVNRRFFALPAIVAGFLLQHAVQGWCPPIPVFRRLGFRTASEIDSERYALKAVRGDFERLPDREAMSDDGAARLLEAMRR